MGTNVEIYTGGQQQTLLPPAGWKRSYSWEKSDLDELQLELDS